MLITKFSTLLGKTITSISLSEDHIKFYTTSGTFLQYHEQDCCETVWLESHDGDINDLIGSPLVMAEEIIEHTSGTDDFESITYSFYKLATIKGSCTFTWRGTSNGYYSETVELYKEED